MKYAVLFILFLQLGITARSAEPIRIAVLAEDPSLGMEVDLVTTAFSRATNVRVLERAELERIYREQGLTAGTDALKVGQLVGARGLLLLTSVTVGTNRFLQVRLAAVEPGSVVAVFRWPWPLAAPAEWGVWVARQFTPFLPKLDVSARDAIPISILGFRAPQTSAESQDLERQMTLLIMERLSREASLFVLERRRLGSLGAEKSFKGMDDSAFWNGAYLLEGVIDRDGYSPATMTLHATLTPSKAGKPIQLECSAGRTNVNALLEQIARKVQSALKQNAVPTPWDPLAEARRYHDEAIWALKWNMFENARIAAEAAWALGKQDTETGLARVRAYLPNLRSVRYHPAERSEWNGQVVWSRQNVRPDAPINSATLGTRTQYFCTDLLPDPGWVKPALRLSDLTLELGRVMPKWEPRPLTAGDRAGLEALEGISLLLQDYSLFRSNRPPADELRDLRGRAREIAARWSAPAAVTDTYWFTNWVCDRATRPESLRGLNIWGLKARYGCFWQERPEDALALYRELTSSAAFSFVHGNLLERPLYSFPLVDWGGSLRLKQAWELLRADLANSRNPVGEIEAAFIAVNLADDRNLSNAVAHAFGTLTKYRGFLVTNLVHSSYLDGERTSWTVHSLIHPVLGREPAPAAKRAVIAGIPALWKPMEGASQESRVFLESIKPALCLARQKQFLTTATPFQQEEFSNWFGIPNINRDIAIQLFPLVTNYISTQVTRGFLDRRTPTNVSHLGFGRVYALAERLRMETSRPEQSLPLAADRRSVASVVPKQDSILPGEPPPPLYGSNALAVTQFVWLPTNQLYVLSSNRTGDNVNYTIRVQLPGVEKPYVQGSRLRAGRLYLDLRYSTPDYRFSMANGRWEERAGRYDQAAMVIWDLRSSRWEVIQYPELSPAQVDQRLKKTWGPGNYFEDTGSAFYTSDQAGFQRYHRKSGQWATLSFPGQQPAELLLIGERLYAANSEQIFELQDQGSRVHILASCRRRPVLSSLDSLESLGHPRLFAEPGGSLRALIHDKLYTLDGKDWKQEFVFPDLSWGSTVTPGSDGLLIQASYARVPRAIWMVSGKRMQELAWIRETPDSPSNFDPKSILDQAGMQPVWRTPTNSWLSESPAAVTSSNLYFYLMPAMSRTTAGWKIVPNPLGEAYLACMERGTLTPVLLPLRFNTASGPVPSGEFERIRMLRNGAPQVWMLVDDDRLLLGHVNVPGFWVIPMTDVRAAVARARGGGLR